MAAVKSARDVPMSEPMAPGRPTERERGRFREVDAIHEGSSHAVNYALGDGTHVVRLEDIRIAKGPDLYAYLAEYVDQLAPSRSKLPSSKSADWKETSATRTTR